MGRTKVSPAKRASAAAASEKAAANAAKRRAAAAEPFDDQVTGVVDQECPPGSPGAEFEAQLRELLEPDQLEPASRVLQVEVHEMFESEPALWDYFVAGAPVIVSDNVAQAKGQI